VLDFVDANADEVLEAFRKYHATAELAGVTDPNLVYNLRAKLDAAGHYDDFEVERVVAAELKPNATQGDVLAAVGPVVDRLQKRFKAATAALKTATAAGDDAAAKAAKDERDALLLFQADMGAFVRLYTFLSQIFDYGNTAIEKRSIFFKVVVPLLEFGREREGIDLSKVVLTHHTLKSKGPRTMPLGGENNPKLDPVTEAGSGAVQEKEKARLREIIEKVNDLFSGELTEQDKLVYVNDVIKGKLLESETLRQQATNNSKEQFANSPDLTTEIMNAVMGALEAHTAMSTQALESEAVRRGLKDVLLEQARLYETLRQKASGVALP
jgi:type I restriction enzyme R subunit